MGRKGQLLSLDLLLALVPLTIVMGMSASAMSGVISTQQDYLYTFHMHRVVMDMA
ncbi:MAG: hypothetical protein GXO65_01635, partial [Euryarchaeota archaeon]|nr:hypothetical protein [Euryarchaeota archaeon]